ncbi:cerato-ulmin [Lepidopterella palustris CBS 459.81]|uniref:Cerato-ulmin n=1 Tax=Lepidopterella palustris CBS 459.81 TaxID=1314670 RepID=A0A8E2E7Z3_9PEZI|nr:cerato-ulmin [Lepidopterella palustris CBS 459.81]
MSVIVAVSTTLAMPATPIEQRQTVVLCPGTDSNPVCCATDVLGVADLNCATPPSTPTSTADFINICAAEGQQAKCCLLPILGQALVCSDVTA